MLGPLSPATTLTLVAFGLAIITLVATNPLTKAAHADGVELYRWGLTAPSSPTP